MKGGGRTAGERERESRKREGPEERRAQKEEEEEEDGCCMNCTVFTQNYFTGRILVKQNGDKTLRRDLKESVATLRQYQQK